MVYADGEVVTEASCRVKNGQFLICSPQLKNVSHVRVEFAQTGFYQVNLYNGADIPKNPFVLEIHSA